MPNKAKFKVNYQLTPQLTLKNNKMLPYGNGGHDYFLQITIKETLCPPIHWHLPKH